MKIIKAIMHRPDTMRPAIWGLCAVMALVLSEPTQAQSVELALGSTMPQADLSRPSANGNQGTLSAARGSKGTVVVFWSNECPWADKNQDRLLSLASEYTGKGFGFVLVNSNDPVAFPKEAREGSRTYMQQSGMNLPYLMDTDGQLARAFGAARTPHVYLFNGSGALVYVGAIDDSPGDPNNVQEHYLRDALNSISSGSSVSVPRTKAFGCTIKAQGGR